MSKPFREIVQAGNTYYIAGRIGIDPATSLPPLDVREEIRLLLDGLRDLLARNALSAKDLVQVHIYTPDVSLYATFNEIYLTYFEGDLPARAFLGSGPLLFGARFELTAVAVRS
jgi:enamine deaminase RidA (YjgF/YER057c/UK114 family)